MLRLRDQTVLERSDPTKKWDGRMGWMSNQSNSIDASARDACRGRSWVEPPESGGCPLGSDLLLGWKEV
uniref:Uncharacterized protein n=1 Tax=Arundo donax TaxID=35708 RepID=A0A0A9CTV2_ARUDO